MATTEQFLNTIHEQINEMVDKKIMLRSGKSQLPINRKEIEKECEREFLKQMESSLEQSTTTCKIFYDYLMHDSPGLFAVVTERLNAIKVESIEDILNIGQFAPEEKILVKIKEMGFEFLNKGEYPKSYYYFSYLTLVQPNNPQVWFLKGMAEHNLTKFTEALQSYDKAIELAPHYIAAHIHRLNCLLAAQRSQEAKKHYEQFMLDFDSREYAGNEFVSKNLGKIKESLAIVR